MELFGEDFENLVEGEDVAEARTLDTLHWYYEGLKLTATTHHYDKQVCKHESVSYSLFNFFNFFSNFCLTFSFCSLWYRN